MKNSLGRYYYLFILYTTWLVPRWDRTTKITVLPVYKLFIYGWPDVVVCCIKMIFLRCCLEDSNLSCVFCWLLLPSWTSRGFEAQPYSPHADDLASTRPFLRFVFGFKLTLKGGVWRYYFYFYMGSPSMRFIKCCRWPIMICKLFALSRRTSSFKFYYLLTTYLLSPGYLFFMGRKCIIWLPRILRV